MKDTTKIKGATYNDDISGLKLDTSNKVHDEDKILFYIAFFNAVDDLVEVL